MDHNPCSGLTLYEIHHLGPHLEQCGKTRELHELLRLEFRSSAIEFDRPASNAWFLAKDAVEDTEGYLNDVQSAWRMAANGLPNSAPQLHFEFRYALIVATMRSLASSVPTELLQALVECGVWSASSAVALVARIPEAEARAEALLALASSCHGKMLERVLREALAVVPLLSPEFESLSSERAQLICRIAEHLPRELAPNAIAQARSIGRGKDRRLALMALLHVLPERELNEVVAEAIGHARRRPDWVRPHEFGHLARHLARCGYGVRALKVIRLIDTSSIQQWATEFESLVLGTTRSNGERRLATLLATENAASPLGRAMMMAMIASSLSGAKQEAARKLALAELNMVYPDGRLFSEGLVGVLPCLADAGRRKLLTEGRRAIDQLKDPYQRAVGLSRIAPLLDREEASAAVDCAFAAIGLIESGLFLAGAVQALAPSLPAERIDEALEAIRRIELNRDAAIQATIRDAIQAIAARLAELGQPERAKAEARRSRKVPIALAKLAPSLPKEERHAALSEALQLSRRTYATTLPTEAVLRFAELGDPRAALSALLMNDNGRSVAKGLGELAPHLGGATLEEAIQAAESLADTWDRIWGLSVLAGRLSDSPRRELVERVVQMVEREAPASLPYIFEGDGGLFKVLPPMLSETQLERVFTAVTTSPQAAGRVELMTDLVTILPRKLRSAVVRALVEGSSEQNDYGRLMTLAKVADYLPLRVLRTTLRDALRCRHGDVVELIAALAKRRGAGEVETLISSIVDDEARAKAFAASVPYAEARLQERLCSAAIRVANQTAGSRFEPARKVKSRVLARVAGRIVQAGRFNEALTVTRSIPAGAERGEALAAITPHMPARLHDEALSIARTIQRRHTRIDALTSIVTYLREKEQERVLKECLEIASRIENETTRASAFATVVPLLPDQLLEPATILVHGISSEGDRLIALRPLLGRAFGADEIVLWRETLRLMSHDGRGAFLGGLRVLLPGIRAHAGSSELPRALQALRDVVRWWP